MNLPETRLRSWQPRQPSAGLKRRVFARQAQHSAMAWLMGSLAPVAACAFLSLIILNSGNGFPAGPAKSGALMGMILSNAYVFEGSQNEQNLLATVVFDSTNRGASTTFHATPFTRTNE